MKKFMLTSVLPPQIRMQLHHYYILDSVVTPIQEEQCTCSSDAVLMVKCKDKVHTARHERDQALFLARHYRNIAEEKQSEKRILKSNLEGQIEIVRNFWRNKIVEGDTRSGRILRAALIRKYISLSQSLLGIQLISI